MSLETRITAVVQAIGGDIKTILANQGSLAALTTADKSSLVIAINELQAAIAAGSVILDTATTGDATHTWSADKIITELNTLKTSIVDGAPAAYDTLMEISTFLTTDSTAISGLLTAIGNRVAFDIVQTLTVPEKLQACQNIGIGDPDYDFVAEYNTAKA